MNDRRNARLSLKIRLFKAEVVEADVPRGLCALRTLTACVPSTTSYYCASSAFGARIVPGTNLYRMERCSRGPVPNALNWKYVSVNLGSPRLLFGKVALGSQSESCLGGWRCKSPSEEVDRRRLGGTAYNKILEAFGAIPRKSKGQQWIAIGVVVKDTAKYAGMWHRGVEKGAEVLDNAIPTYYTVA